MYPDPEPRMPCRLLPPLLLLTAFVAPRGARAQIADEDVYEIEASPTPTTSEPSQSEPATPSSAPGPTVPTATPPATPLVAETPPAPPETKPLLQRLEAWADRKEGWWTKAGVRVSGYVQAQYEHHQLSQDEVDVDGNSLNLDRFLIRRGRLKVDRTWAFAAVALEIDANTVRGPFVSVRRAEGALFLANPNNERVPWVQLTAGLTDIPFGAELGQRLDRRIFMERTAGSLAYFRGEPDAGARLSGGAGPFRYNVGILNGVPVDDRPGANNVKQTARPTFVGRLGFDHEKDGRVEIGGGASWLAGTGFHAGTPATKSVLSWLDANQDGFVTLNELVAQPGQAATPSVTFPQWAANVDLHVGFHTRLGWTRLQGEATVATNLDRSYLPSDPIATGYDIRGFSAYGAVLQDFTPFAFAGVRVDTYEPNSDLFDARRGVFIPATASLTTVSPVAGVQLPHLGRLAFQYDRILDQLGRDERGEPVGLANDVWTLRLQMEF
ncbi:MAG: hypothetical protein RLZZ383_458 [Pseudomonadota bacterium]|jgi:hypothetical protein